LYFLFAMLRPSRSTLFPTRRSSDLVVDGFLKPDGSAFTQKTLENIEDGQKHLSMGIVQGGRNILSHEEITDLQQSGLFTEKDCRSEEHTSELQSRENLVCRLLLEKK